MATILNDVTSISSGMSQNQWVKCLCQVVEIIKVCPINFCRIQRHNKTQGGPMAALTPFSLAKMHFTSKRILRKEGLKNVYNLLGSFLLTSRCDKYYIN